MYDECEYQMLCEGCLITHTCGESQTHRVATGHSKTDSELVRLEVGAIGDGD